MSDLALRPVWMMTDAELMAEATAINNANDTTALRNPVSLARHLDPKYKLRAHVRLIGEALGAISHGSGDRLMILTPPQVGKPVSCGSMILMADGSRKPLGAVEVGDRVVTHLGRPRTVTAVHEQGELPVVRIVTHGGRETVAALDHPFLTPQGWVQAGDLVPGDVLALVPRPQVEADSALTGEEARLLGCFVGDGSLGGTDDRGSFNAGITIVSPAVLAEVTRCASALGFGIGRTAKVRSDKAPYYGLTGGVREWLRGHGLAKTNSYTKRVPPEVFRAAPHVIAEFIAGYWDCDGTVTFRGTGRDGQPRRDVAVELYSVSRDLLMDVQHLLLRLGIRATLRVKKGTYKQAEHISYRLQLIRSDDVARFRMAVSLVHERRAANLAAATNSRTDFDAPLLADPVVSVTAEGHQDCRCLTVEEDHTFTSDDLVVHNTVSVAVWFPFWWLIKWPEDRVIIGSYNNKLALARGRSVRKLVNEHGHRYGISLERGSQAVTDWQLTSGGGVKSVGVGGGVVGAPGDLVIIDDPHKSRAEADSQRIRDKVYDWMSGDINSRRQPQSPICVIMCIVASMRILLGDGRWVEVEKVRPGDTVVSLAHDRKSLVTAKVIGQRLSGYDETVTVQTNRLSLRVNGAHPFAVLNRSRRYTRGPANIEWVRADELKPGDIAVTCKSLPADYVASDVLPDGSPVSEDLAWLLGYLLGDGWVTAHVRKNQQGTPTSYAVCCSRTVSSRPEKAGLDERVHALLTAFSPNKVYSTPGGYWRIDWNAGGRLLRSMGYSAGSHNKIVPDVVWNWSTALRRAFLKGYAEADGALQHDSDRGQTWRTTSNSPTVLNSVRDLALTCGVRPTRVFVGKPRVYQPPNSPNPITAQLCSLGLTFCHDKAEGVIFIADAKHPDPEHIRYERIKSVESGPVLPVYDISVEDTENFVAEGFVTHNTRWHADDLGGRLLKEQGTVDEGGRWRVIHMPAFAIANDPLGRAPGDPLPHPKIHPKDRAALTAHWEEKRATSSVRDWHSQYMGDPKPTEGALVTEQLMRDRSIAATDAAPPVINAVAVDPSGGGRDEAGIIGGYRGTDNRVYWTHDLTAVMPTAEWARTAVELAYTTDAEMIIFESTFGGDQAGLIIRTAWDAMCAKKGLKNRLCPRIVAVPARKNKRLRAEPVSQQLIEDRVRLIGYHPELIQEWCTWMPTDSHSPGRIDASVYLTLALLGNEPTDVGTATPPEPDDGGPPPQPPALPVMPGTPRPTGGPSSLPVVPGFARPGSSPGRLPGMPGMR